MKYRIKWYATKTGKSGYGTAVFSEEQAQQIADTNNAADEVGVVHTIEAVPETKKDEAAK